MSNQWHGTVEQLKVPGVLKGGQPAAIKAKIVLLFLVINPLFWLCEYTEFELNLYLLVISILIIFIIWMDVFLKNVVKLYRLHLYLAGIRSQCVQDHHQMCSGRSNRPPITMRSVCIYILHSHAIFLIQIQIACWCHVTGVLHINKQCCNMNVAVQF